MRFKLSFLLLILVFITFSISCASDNSSDKSDIQEVSEDFTNEISDAISESYGEFFDEIKETEQDKKSNDNDESDVESPAEGQVKIIRDIWGVPHIISNSDYGVMFGYGYALAEDQCENALSAIWTALGRRTEIDGEQALGIDTTMRLIRLVDDVKDNWDKIPEKIRNILTGFTDGFNKWMEEHPDKVPAYAEPLKPWWVAGLGRLIFFIPQVRQANSELNGLCSSGLAMLSSSTDMNEHYIGSNGWALMPKKTEDGIGIFLGDPHLPYKYEFRFYEVHLKGKTIDVAGASFIGVPLPVLGRSQHVAWTWTWNHPDHGDVYKLKLSPDDPEKYIFDGEEVPFEKVETEFKMPDGSVIKKELRWSIHGPVVCINKDEGYAVSYRLSAFGQIGTFEQFYEMITAKNLDEFNNAMKKLQIFHFNLIAADNSGNIEYFWGGRIPKKNPEYDYSKPVDGTTSDSLWSYDSVYDFMELPHVINPEEGYVQNCNNRPQNTLGTENDPDPESFKPWVVAGHPVDTVRAWYLRKRLKEKEKFTEEEALALATDGFMIPYEPLMPKLLEAWDKYSEQFEFSEEIENIINAFSAWDGMPAKSATAPGIFLVWLYEYSKKTILSPDLFENLPDELDEQTGIEMLTALYNAKLQLEDIAGISLIPWGVIHRIKKGNKSFAVEMGQYPAISLMNSNVDFSNIQSVNDINCTVGSSYTFFNVMGDKIKTYSVLPLGQTDDPESPYFSNMTELFAKRELKPLPITTEEIEQYKLSEKTLQF